MNDQTLNTDIVKALKDGIRSFCYFDGAGGNSIDNMIVNTIKRYCPYIHVVDLPSWLTIQSQPLYRSVKDKAQEIARTEICDCLDLRFSGYFESPTLIRQPNNTQQWPDILIVYKHLGISIEVKSSKYDQIVWNSGLPRVNGIYIYNGGLIASGNVVNTTYFLGQHVLSLVEMNLLHKAREANHKVSDVYNELLSNSKWSLYARPMFNYTGKFLMDEHREQREIDVHNFIGGLVWG